LCTETNAWAPSRSYYSPPTEATAAEPLQTPPPRARVIEPPKPPMQVWDAGQFWQAASGVRGNGCGVISIFHSASGQGRLPSHVNSPSDLFSAVAAFAAPGGPGDAVFRALVMANPPFVDNHVQAVLDPLRDWAVDPFGSQLGDYELYRDRYAFAGGHMWQEVEIQLVATYLGHAIRVRSSYHGQDQRTFYPVTVTNGAATPVIGLTPPLEIFHSANHFQPITTAEYEALHQPAIHADQFLLFLRQNEVTGGPPSACAANLTGPLCGPLFRGGADSGGRGGGGGGGGGGGESEDVDSSYEEEEEEDNDGCMGFCDGCDNSQCKGHDAPDPFVFDDGDDDSLFRIFLDEQFSDGAATARNAHLQGSPEWLQARIRIITASVVGEFTGVSTYGTATTQLSGKLDALKDGYSPPAPTIHMRHGSLMEKPVMEFVKQLQVSADILTVQNPVFETSLNLLSAPGYGCLGYSADGTVFGIRAGSEFGALIEIKCPCKWEGDNGLCSATGKFAHPPPPHPLPQTRP
jgi:hypothetical protein